jgi:diacylglycerol kinase family enzyme
MEHLFIINPKSFYKKMSMDRVIREITEHFRVKNEWNFSIHLSRFPRDAIIVIRRHLMSVDPGVRVRVYAVGGDGVAFCCLNGIIGMPNAELALLPFGTGNDFVRAFGMEHYHDFRDIALQTAAPVIPMDVIRCGGNYALNCCTVGMEASALIKTLPLNARFERQRRVFPALNAVLYVAGGFGAVFDERILGQKYELFADGEDLSGAYNAINIANGPYYGVGKTAVPSAIPNDGVLDMLISKDNSPAHTLKMLNAYLHGGWNKLNKYFIFRRIKKVAIHSPTPLLVNLDGEPFFDTRLEIEVVPHAVNIVAVHGLSYHGNADE